MKKRARVDEYLAWQISTIRAGTSKILWLKVRSGLLLTGGAAPSPPLALQSLQCPRRSRRGGLAQGGGTWGCCFSYQIHCRGIKSQRLGEGCASPHRRRGATGWQWRSDLSLESCICPSQFGNGWQLRYNEAHARDTLGNQIIWGCYVSPPNTPSWRRVSERTEAAGAHLLLTPPGSNSSDPLALSSEQGRQQQRNQTANLARASSGPALGGPPGSPSSTPSLGACLGEAPLLSLSPACLCGAGGDPALCRPSSVPREAL